MNTLIKSKITGDCIKIVLASPIISFFASSLRAKASVIALFMACLMDLGVSLAVPIVPAGVIRGDTMLGSAGFPPGWCPQVLVVGFLSH